MSIKKILTFTASLSLVLMLLLTATAQAVFGNMRYFQKEFEKYSVTDNIDMEMDDIMYVMDELMDYLHGDREDLENIITEVNGSTGDFFSEREKIHMADCKVLFDAGFLIRSVSAVVFLLSICILWYLKKLRAADIIKCAGFISLLITIIVVVLGIAASIDFNACFIIFHKLLFSNDLWLLDPAEDMIINILVEPFFADMALKIALYCAVVLIVLMFFGAGIYLADKKRRKI